jgi:hypothetical protein
MAKHRPTPAPAKPRLTRRAARYALRLPWRLARLVLRSALATLRGAWWLTRGLAVGTVGLAGLAVVVPLVVLALLAGRSGVQLRDALVTYVLEPFGKRVQAKRNPLPEPAPAPAPAKSKGKGKAKGKAKAKGKSKAKGGKPKPAPYVLPPVPAGTDPWPPIVNDWGPGQRALRGLRDSSAA